MRRVGKFLVRLGLGLLSLCSVQADAQFTAPYVALTGTLSGANGMPARNYSLLLEPTQVMFVGGTAVVVSGANCATDANGQLVGSANPLSAPVTAATYGSGTMLLGNYFVKITWYDSYGHETLPSVEAAVQLTASGSIVISPPVAGAPSNVVGMDVYVGTTTGGETYQGQTASTTASFTQAVPPSTTGRVPPIQNNTVCIAVANDAAWPIAGYNATLMAPNGNAVPGFPQQWQLLGPGSSYNLSNGLPLYNGRVTYPVPVLTQPYNHNAQSISGPLSLTGYSLYNVGALGVGTALPGWGVDVEGTGAAAEINAAAGYLYNGTAPLNHLLLGNGTAYVDAASIPYSIVTGGPSINTYYQFVTTGKTAGSALPQQFYLATGAGTGLIATNVNDVAPNVSRTVLNVNAYPSNTTINTDGYVVMTAAGGTSGQFACWDATTGGISGSTTPCASLGTNTYYLNQTACTPAASTDAGCSATQTISQPDTGYEAFIQMTSSAGAWLLPTVTTKSAASIAYQVTCTFNCATMGTVSADIYVHHP